MNIKKNRIICFDFLKIICTILVIINHSHLYFTESGRVLHLFHFLLFSICKIAVPIFLMITGFLILDRDNNYSVILKKRIPRIYLACLFSTIIGIAFYNMNIINTFIKFLFGGQSYTLFFLWYIYDLIILYLLAPLLKKMISRFSIGDYKHFFIIFMVIPSFVLFCSDIFENFFNINDLCGKIFNQIPFLVNIGYFVIGYYIFKNRSEKRIKRELYLLLISIISLIIYLCFGYLKYHQIIDIKYNCLPVVIMSVCFFDLFLFYYKKSSNNIFNEIIIKLSESSLGIYLTHVYLIEFLMKTNFFIKLFRFNLFIGYYFLIVFVYIFLCFLFYLIRKVPIFAKIF